MFQQLRSLKKSSKKRLIRSLGGALAWFGFLTLLNYTGVLDQIERATLDFRYQHFNRDAHASAKVVVIDVDEQSMKLLGPHLGKWPWSRSIYQNIIQFISSGEPAGIFFDILFTEKSITDDGDVKLAQATQESGIVSHGMLLLEDPSTELSSPTERVPLPQDFVAKFSVPIFTQLGNPLTVNDLRDQLPYFRDFLLPNPTILPATTRVHVVSTAQDNDGVYRRTPILFSYADNWLPSLTLRAVLATLKDSNTTFQPSPSGGSELNVQGTDENNAPKTYKIPMDSRGNFSMHFYKALPGYDPETIPIAAVISSAAQLMSGGVEDFTKLQVNPTDFKNKIILIGGSAAGLNDLKTTPTNRAYPGPLLHATAISNILTQDFAKRLAPEIKISLGLLTLFLVYLSFYFIESMVLKVMIPLLWGSGYVIASFYLFQKQSLWIELAGPGILWLGGSLDALTYLIFVENKEKKSLKSTLSKYLPPSVTDQIIANEQNPQAEVGSKRELSILFSDIRGFTSLSEKLPPEQVVQILNHYLGKMTEIVFNQTGTLDKFIGDAVMAFWGAPITDPNHALHSVYCALEMMEAMTKINQDFLKEGKSQLSIGIGINTGEVIVGNIGSERRLDYTVIGDNVNLASRMEGLTKQYSAPALVSERTAECAGNSIVFRPIDLVRVKGKENHIKICEPLCLASSPDVDRYRELASRFEEALKAYHSGNFDHSLQLFRETDQFWAKFNSTLPGDLVSQGFIEKCQELLLHPPKTWDGVFVTKSK